MCKVFQTLNSIVKYRQFIETSSWITTCIELTIPVWFHAIFIFILQVVLLTGEDPDCISLQSLLNPNLESYVAHECDAKTSTAIMFSSSGTTGFPKTVKMSNFSLVANYIVAT